MVRWGKQLGVQCLAHGYLGSAQEANWHLSSYQSTLHIGWSKLYLNQQPSGSQAKSPRTELLHNFRLIIHQNLPFDFVIQGSPVKYIAWGEVSAIHIAFDLSSGEDRVPHVDFSNHTNERLICIKTPTIGVLLLAQDGDGCSTDGLSFDESLDGRFAVHPQLSHPIVRAPGCTHGLPGVWRQRQRQEVSAPIPSVHPDDILWFDLKEHEVVAVRGSRQREEPIVPGEIGLESEQMCQLWEIGASSSSNKEAFRLQPLVTWDRQSQRWIQFEMSGVSHNLRCSPWGRQALCLTDLQESEPEYRPH